MMGACNQVFLGLENLVDEIRAHLPDDKDLSEITLAKKRSRAKPLDYYIEECGSRNEAICAAFKSGDYGMKTLGEYFNFCIIQASVELLGEVKNLHNLRSDRIPHTVCIKSFNKSLCKFVT